MKKRILRVLAVVLAIPMLAAACASPPRTPAATGSSRPVSASSTAAAPSSIPSAVSSRAENSASSRPAPVSSAPRQTGYLAATVQDMMITLAARPGAATANLDAAGLQSFSLEMLRRCETSGKSTLVSPLSVYLVLAMVAGGAGGNTRAQFESLLGAPYSTLAPQVGGLLKNLSGRAKADRVDVRIANSIWCSKRYPEPKKSFLQLNADYFGAGIFRFDNADPSGTLRSVNGWVDDKTNHLIPGILTQVNPTDYMYLISALYFKGAWVSAFSEQNNRKGDFTHADGTKSDVTYMAKSGGAYLTDGGACGVSMGFYGQFAFAGNLPPADMPHGEFLATLTPSKLQALLATDSDLVPQVELPKFEAENSFDLGDTLAAMGISDALDQQRADFSGIAENIWVCGVVHKTRVRVYEAGLEAAAVTAVKTAATSLTSSKPVEYVTVRFDRPFLYLLYDQDTGVPLFMGTYE